MELEIILSFSTDALKKIGNSKHILAWKSKWMSNESIKPPVTSNNSLSPALHFMKKLKYK